MGKSIVIKKTISKEANAKGSTGEQSAGSVGRWLRVFPKSSHKRIAVAASSPEAERDDGHYRAC